MYVYCYSQFYYVRSWLGLKHFEYSHYRARTKVRASIRRVLISQHLRISTCIYTPHKYNTEAETHLNWLTVNEIRISRSNLLHENILNTIAENNTYRTAWAKESYSGIFTSKRTNATKRPHACCAACACDEFAVALFCFDSCICVSIDSEKLD